MPLVLGVRGVREPLAEGVVRMDERAGQLRHHREVQLLAEVGVAGRLEHQFDRFVVG